MPDSNRKGRQGENEWAALWGGKRISERGATGPDVRTPDLVSVPLNLWEVKRKEKWHLKTWIRQAKAEGAQAIAFRENGGEWLVLMPATMLRKVEVIEPQIQESDDQVTEKLNEILDILKDQHYKTRFVNMPRTDSGSDRCKCYDCVFGPGCKATEEA